MPEDLEKVVETKVMPLVDSVMQQYLGVTISEVRADISDKLKKTTMIDFEIDTRLPFKKAKKQFKKNYFAKLLRGNFGNVSEAAKKASVERRSVHRAIAELKIDVEQARKEMQKMEYVKQTEVQNILESSFDIRKPALNPIKFEKMYKQIPLLSKEIVKELPDKALTFEEAEKEFEKRFFKKLLEENNWNTTAAARKTKLRYETLHRKLKKLGF